MEELSGIFVGYKSFISQKKNKRFYVISLLFVSVNDEGTRADYIVKDIFVDENKYSDFLKSYSLMSAVDVKRGIVGDSVRYYI